jgi:cbb3-type cytochrome oxidase maturation protein
MFYLGWLMLIAVGVGVSLGVFVWALKTGQFSDQQRARFLPLKNEQLEMPQAQPLPSEVYALILVVILGIIFFLSTITLTIYRLHG